MSNKFQLQIPEPCHESWDKMDPVEQGRFCNSCQKAVVDFTGMSDAQLVAFFKKPSTGSVCGRFNDDQLQRDIAIPGKRMPWLKYFFQLAIPVFLTSLKAQSQGNIVLKERATPTIAPNTCTKALQGTVGAVSLAVTSKKIYGHVVDDKGVGVPFASIRIKDSDNGVICDSTGLFELQNKGHVRKNIIVASCVGYTEIEKEINVKEEDLVKIQLMPKSSLNGEVVVTSYVGTRKGMVVGVVATVKRSYLQKLKDYFNQDSIKVYPNPARSGSDLKIEIKNQETGEVQIDIFNLAGQLISTSEVNNHEKNSILTYQLPNVIAGTYLLRITNKRSKKIQAEKIIIQ